jgi:hypothetical protein
MWYRIEVADSDKVEVRHLMTADNVVFIKEWGTVGEVPVISIEEEATPNLITWVRWPFRLDGKAGGIRIFTIFSTGMASDPQWTLRCTLPGYSNRSQAMKHDDEDVLKLRAEKILRKWLDTVEGS